MEMFAYDMGYSNGSIWSPDQLNWGRGGGVWNVEDFEKIRPWYFCDILRAAAMYMSLMVYVAAPESMFIKLIREIA